jgi:hypothetical protein
MLANSREHGMDFCHKWHDTIAEENSETLSEWRRLGTKVLARGKHFISSLPVFLRVHRRGDGLSANHAFLNAEFRRGLEFRRVIVSHFS